MNKVKQSAKLFFSECFRIHGKDEYSELITRGVSDCDGENRTYPWFYLRVFCVLAVVFTLYAVIQACMPAGGNRQTFYFIGGAFLDIALLILFFELYPYKDISLLCVLCVCITGGTFAQFISAIIYNLFPSVIISRSWDLAAVAGIGEEIAKAIPAILCIIILKKKHRPFAGFLIGAAVGTWFSFTENASYISSEIHSYMQILTATARALGAPFSHMTWTALICWAFCKFKRPYINLKFYAVVLFCMAMHFCIDMPLWDYIFILFTEAAVCGIATFIFGVTVIYKERKTALHKYQKQLFEIPRLALTQVTNITFSAFGAVLCALLLLFAAVFTVDTYDINRYTVQEFLNLVQDGYEITADYERSYDENLDNYTEVYEQGVLTFAEQRIEDGEITYIYCYTLTEVEDETDEDSEPEKQLKLLYVYLIMQTDDELKKSYFPVTYIFTDDNGNEFELRYYKINSELKGTVKYEIGMLAVYKTSDRLNWQSITLLCAIAAVAAGGTGTYIVLRKKARY